MADKKKQKKRHLGRGLDSLLASTTAAVSVSGTALRGSSTDFPPDSPLQTSVREVPIKNIRPNPYQPRTAWNDEDLCELADSIRANGILQPILLRQVDSHYEVIAGERRLRASEIVGMDKVPALIRQAKDEEMLELALVENIHRVDLNPMERALAYQEYITSFSFSQTEAARRLGEDRSVVANYLRLLGLPKVIQQMLIERKLSMGHARAILSLPTDELRRKLANRALAGQLSVREVERLVRRQLSGSDEPSTPPKEKPAHIVDLENRMRETLGTKVTINARKNGKRGKIVIEFYSLDEFDRLTDKIGITSSDTV